MPYADREKRLAYHRRYNKKTYKAYYRKYRERLLKKTQDYRKKNPNHITQYARKYRRQLKETVLATYGGKCAICGETHIECLTIDHSFNDGAEWRRSFLDKKSNRDRTGNHGQSFYHFLRANNFPKDLGLRVLCWNCNCSIGLYGYSPLSKRRRKKV